MSTVHIIYLTSKCNFDCKYCYEKNTQTEIDLSCSDLDKIIDEIIAKDGISNDLSEQTIVCLFGGEPLLKYNEIVYVMKKLYTYKHNIHFQIISNGYMFSKDKFLYDYYRNPFIQKGFLTLAISYDGIGQHARLFKGKDSTPILLEVFRRLRLLKLPFEISYTITKYNYHGAYDDIIKIFHEFNPQRILVNFDRTGLTSDEYEQLYAKRDYVKDRINVCFFDCKTCDKCEFTKSERQYYSDKGCSCGLNQERDGKFNDFLKYV